MYIDRIPGTAIGKTYIVILYILTSDGFNKYKSNLMNQLNI